MVKVNVALLCKSTSSLKKRKIDETPDQFLKQVTHLYLNGKNIEVVGSEIALCKNLNVLYLYDNKLRIAPDLTDLTQLTHLYLQNNHITKIEGLNKLSKLEKLYLSHNRISVIEGLEGLSSLRELRIDHQQVPPGDRLLFDEDSVRAIAGTLVTLDVSENGLESLEDVVALRNLLFLSARNNRLASLTKLAQALANWVCLLQLELNGNPVMKNPKAKDVVIVSAGSLKMLDGKPITEAHRQFVENWNQFCGTRLALSEKETPVQPIFSPMSHDLNSLETAYSKTSIPSFDLASSKRTLLTSGERSQMEPLLLSNELSTLDKPMAKSAPTGEFEDVEWTPVQPEIGPSGCGVDGSDELSSGNVRTDSRIVTNH